jgi:hypothetical protein
LMMMMPCIEITWYEPRCQTCVDHSDKYLHMECYMSWLVNHIPK